MQAPAVLWITKEGATWRALPKVYGKTRSTVDSVDGAMRVFLNTILHEHFHDAGNISGILHYNHGAHRQLPLIALKLEAERN